MKNIKEILNQLGIPAHLSGRSYIEAGVKHIIENPDKTRIYKEVYPAIAEMTGKTATAAERCIRHAIHVMMQRGDTKLINGIFGYTIDPNKGKPEVGMFLMALAEYVKDEQTIQWSDVL